MLHALPAQLQEENRALAAQIKALKEQLGLDVVERCVRACVCVLCTWKQYLRV